MGFFWDPASEKHKTGPQLLRLLQDLGDILTEIDDYGTKYKIYLIFRKKKEFILKKNVTLGVSQVRPYLQIHSSLVFPRCGNLFTI